MGPYETVTLSTDKPDALAEWLADNGYMLPDDVRPIIDAYVAEGFDFIALKQAVKQITNLGVSRVPVLKVLDVDF